MPPGVAFGNSLPQYGTGETDRSWANFSLLSLYSRRNAWAILHLLGQPDTYLAAVDIKGVWVQKPTLYPDTCAVLLARGPGSLFWVQDNLSLIRRKRLL